MESKAIDHVINSQLHKMKKASMSYCMKPLYMLRSVPSTFSVKRETDGIIIVRPTAFPEAKHTHVAG